jgi:hypothetical protein
MPGILGYATFPGIRQTKSCTFTLSHGITPSVAVLEFAPPAEFTGEGGDLVFLYGNASIVFPDCKVDFQTLQRTDHGLIWSFHILDRRWKWRFGSISGTYNVRLDDGTIDPAYQLAPQDLATLLLQTMGESAFDVSQLPNDSYPFVEWAADNPAQALADLCDSLGCRVVLTLSNAVLIARIGVGVQLPDGPMVNNSLSINPPELPDSITVVGGKARYQTDWVLYPVGLDSNGQIKPLSRLSYAPSPSSGDGMGGFSLSAFPPFFDDISDVAITMASSQPPQTQALVLPQCEPQLTLRKLAQLSVWRWFQIQLLNPDGSSPFRGIPGCPVKITDLKQIELESEQVAVMLDPTDGKVVNIPAMVHGRFYSDDFAFAVTPFGTQYQKGFSIDPVHRMVKFSDYVYAYEVDGSGNNTGYLQESPPVLYLRTACSVRDPQTFAFVRSIYTIPLGGTWNTGTKIVKRDEIVLGSIANWDVAGGSMRSLGTSDNSQDVQAESQYYANAATLEFQLTDPQEIHYAGLVPISPDGAIQQITWSVGTPWTTTRVCRNNEFSPAVPPYRTRRLFEMLKSDRLKQVNRIAGGLVTDSKQRPVPISSVGLGGSHEF